MAGRVVVQQHKMFLAIALKFEGAKHGGIRQDRVRYRISELEAGSAQIEVAKVENRLERHRGQRWDLNNRERNGALGQYNSSWGDRRSYSNLQGTACGIYQADFWEPTL